MFTIKNKPEDFLVEEVTNISIGKDGNYAIYLLEKKDLGTEEAIQLVSKKIHVPRRNIGYAGLKDRHAVTKQYISIRDGKNQEYTFPTFSLAYQGRSKEKIALGMLKFNKFIIKVLADKKSLTIFDKKVALLEGKSFFMPNYFGNQRFSKNNHDVGKALVKKDFKLAAELLKEQNHLETTNNPIQAMRSIPRQILTIFVNAYQSSIFNEILTLIEKKINKDAKLPLIGYGTEVSEYEQYQKIIQKVLDREELTPRDFVIRQMPEVASYGSTRNAFIQLQNFTFKKEIDGVTLSFELPPGSYATVVVDYLFGVL